MQLNVQALAKKAINAALDQEWEKAVEINEEILEKSPDNKDAKTRLGRAYLKTKDYTKAKKIFKEILDADPINKIAQKNYKLASEKKDDVTAGREMGKATKAYIKEPGTSIQVEVVIEDKRMLKSIELGQSLDTRCNKKTLNLVNPATKKSVGSISDGICDAAYKAKVDGKDIKAKVIKIKEESIVVTLSCKSPIFKSEKQQEKPFMKMDLSEEPEIDVSETENS
jgi:tetratricopeptide (TPR) repeat protein